MENKDELPEVLDITELEVLPPNHPTPQASKLCQIRTCSALRGWVHGCSPSMQQYGLLNGTRVIIEPLPREDLLFGSMLQFNNTVLLLGEERIVPTINNWHVYINHQAGKFSEFRGEIYGDPRFLNGEKVCFQTDKPHVLKFGGTCLISGIK